MRSRAPKTISQDQFDAMAKAICFQLRSHEDAINAALGEEGVTGAGAPSAPRSAAKRVGEIVDAIVEEVASKGGSEDEVLTTRRRALAVARHLLAQGRDVPTLLYAGDLSATLPFEQRPVLLNADSPYAPSY